MFNIYQYASHMEFSGISKRIPRNGGEDRASYGMPFITKPTAPSLH